MEGVDGTHTHPLLPVIKAEIMDSDNFPTRSPDRAVACQCEVSTQTDNEFAERFNSSHLERVKNQAEYFRRQVVSLSRCLLSATEEMGEALEEASDLSLGGFSFPSQALSADLPTNFAVGEPVDSGNNEIAPSTILNSQSHLLPTVENSSTSNSRDSPYFVQALTLPSSSDSHEVGNEQSEEAEVTITGETVRIIKEEGSPALRSPDHNDDDETFKYLVDSSPTPPLSLLKNKERAHFLNHSSSVSPAANKRPRLGQGAVKGAQSKKRFTCHLCAYSTLHSHHLKNHLRTHSGEKPFKCDQCDFASAQKSSLKTHLRNHTGEKPFKCPYCEYRTAHSGHLSGHVRTHTGERPFQCHQCDFRAIKKGHLMDHIRIHTGERPYKCTQCPYAAAQRGSLLQHKRSRHSA